MLKSPTPSEKEMQRRKRVFLEMGIPYIPQSDPRFVVEEGIFIPAIPFSFVEDEFEEFQNMTYDDRYGFSSDIGNKSVYGVADNIEQIKEYYKEAIDDPNNNYTIFISQVFQNKENAGKGGGWRWHKWGPYIGKLDSQCEYLDDEKFGDDFSHVITFQIMRFKKS